MTPSEKHTVDEILVSEINDKIKRYVSQVGGAHLDCCFKPNKCAREAKPYLLPVLCNRCGFDLLEEIAWCEEIEG